MDDRATIELRDYVDVVRRRWTVIAAGAAVGLVLALLFSAVRTPQYESTVNILIRPTTTDPVTGVQDVNRLVNTVTEREIAGSAEVASLARNRLGSDRSITALLQDLAVRAVPDSQVLELTFTSTDAVVARDSAQAFAEAYLEFRNAEAAEVAERAALSRDTQADLLQADIDALDQRIRTSNADTAITATLISERQLLVSRVADLRSEAALLRDATIDGGTIIDAAEVPSAAAGLGTGPVLIAGLLLGLLGGVALAFLLQRTIDRVEAGHTLERQGINVLGALTAARGDETLNDPASIAFSTGPIAVAVHKARSRLLHAVDSQGRSSMLVTGASENSLSSEVAGALAMSIVRTGRRVLVIDLDRSATASSLLGSRSGPGFDSVVSGRVPIEDAMQPWEVDPRVQLLPPRTPRDVAADLPPPARATAVAGNEALRHALERARRHVDLTLVVTAASDITADAMVLAPIVEGVVVVADARDTNTGVLDRLDDLQDAGGHVMGVVTVERAGQDRSARRSTDRDDTPALAAS